MRTRIPRLMRLICVAGFLFGLTPVAQAQSFKLLAPGVGWMSATRNKLLWTSDHGKAWKDVSPPVPQGSVISAIFFLDTEHGWVLLARGEPDLPSDMNFDVARTDNGGATWSVTPMDERLKGALVYGASFSFADPDHGWLGALVTFDGGRTWNSSHSPTHRPGDFAPGRSLTMVTPHFGWAVRGPINDKLYVTRDGGKSWQPVVLESPVETDRLRKAVQNAHQFERSFMQALPPTAATQRANADAAAPHEYYNDTFAHYSLPVFTNPSHGHIVVSYPGVAVLFGTDDGGVTWKPQANITGRVIGPSAVVSSTWITADVPRHTSPQLRKLGPGASAFVNEPLGPELSTAEAMTFITPNEGWVVTVDHRLFSTTDGGAKWSDITPSSK